MIKGMSLLLIFQLIGEVISFAANGIVPGPVIGLILLVAAMLLSRLLRGYDLLEPIVGGTSDGLLSNLGVLFVPAGVGVIQNIALIADRGIAIAVVLLISTTITLAATVWTFVALKHIQTRRRSQ